MIKNRRFNFRNTRTGLYELKHRLLFVILSILIFRIGSFIPIPGIDIVALAKLFAKQHNSIIEMFNTFSGGALSRASIFALGSMPYISASIIIQIITVMHPSLLEMKKEGEIDRHKINQYTRYITLALAVFQSIGIVTGLPNISGMQDLIINPSITFYLTAIISLVCGTMFLIWLGEKISERGIGNGISIIIFAGIVANLPTSLINIIEKIRQGSIHILSFVLFIALMFIMTFLIVFIERSQRLISVNYAQRQQGRRVYSAHSAHLPLKINMAGVIPAVFASSIILLMATIISWAGKSFGWYWLYMVSNYLQPSKPLYILFHIIAIVFFCFFYTNMIFNPRDTSDNLKKSGAFIPGVRPGEYTAKYISKIINHLTLIDAIYIIFICLIPELIHSMAKMSIYFGGTSLLIVVVVVMDFMTQIQTLIISNQYDSIFKKSNIRNYNR